MNTRRHCHGPCAGLCTDTGFTTAYREHRVRLVTRAQALVGDRQHAEDAVQEAFLRAWAACASFDPAGPPLDAWLTTITRNVAIDQHRARAVRPRPARDQPSHADRADHRPGPDHVVLREVLVQALSTVSADHRAVVLKTVVRDRAYADVASELGVPVGTVKSRVHHALRGLRSTLTPIA